MQRLGLAVLALLSSACASQVDAPRPAVSLHGVALPAGPVVGAPWAAQGCDPAGVFPQGTGPQRVVACVRGAADAGVAITAAEVERAAAALAEPADVTQVVAALVREELLAQVAAKSGLWTDALVPVGRQVMAQRLLEAEAAKITPATVKDADIQFALSDPNIKLMFNRAPSYFVTDAQVLCCTGDAHGCSKREEVQRCIEERKDEAEAIFAYVQAHPPATGIEMEGMLQAEVGRFPHVAVAEVVFYYDKTKAWDKQGAYDLMVPEFAIPVAAMEPGQIHAPIRSPFGWHIPRLERFEPAVNKSPADPQVRAEIATNILTPVRGRDMELFAVAQMKAAGVELFFERLDAAAGVSSGEEAGGEPSGGEPAAQPPHE